jgi:hypothetical protein
MFLIQEELFEKLYHKYRQGVPISRLIQQHSLAITHPTLTKLIMYYDAWQEAYNDEVGSIIFRSLFPEWLTNNQDNKNVLLQPPEWRYEGKMPLGQWVKNEWATNETTRQEV